MFGLKNVYLYFLSIKKILIKSLKEIFFQTKFYNNTLNSETPSRFFFQPNPYLLSPLFNHESFKFKISKDNIYNFWDKNFAKEQDNNIHNFLWLNLIDRKNDKEIIQSIIHDWIKNFNVYNKNTWRENIIAKRLISWLSNSDIILDNTKKDFEKNFCRA